MNLIDYAKQAPQDQSEQEFVDSLKSIVGLGAIANLSETERDRLLDTVQYLSDFVLFLREAKGELTMQHGAPMVEYGDPFVPNALTRPEGATLDLDALENFGVGAADRYFGSEWALNVIIG